MIALFKRNVTLQYVVIVILAVVMLVGHLVQILSSTAANGESHLGWMPHLGGSVIETFIAFILVFAEGYWLNRLLYKCKLVAANSLLPMLLYILLMTAQGPWHLWSPMLLVNLLLLAVLRLTLVFSERPSISDQSLLSAAALCALCTIILPSAWILFFFLMVVLTRFQLYTWRYWVLALLGFLVPYFPWLLIHYLSGDLVEALSSYWQQVICFRIVIEPTNWAGWVENIFFLILLVGGTAFGLSLRNDRTEVGNLNNALLMNLFLVGLLSLFYKTLFPVWQQAFALPFAYIVSLVFLSVPRKWYWGLTFIALIVFFVISAFNYV